MCGRYSLGVRMAHVRQEMEDAGWHVDQAPPDDNNEVRETHNFAPGNVGVVYRAGTPGPGLRGENPLNVPENAQDKPVLHDGADDKGSEGDAPSADTQPALEHKAHKARRGEKGKGGEEGGEEGGERPCYKLQAMKWGLVPSWTKQAPSSYGALLKTINCRDDSLALDKGMWTPMKKQKRCVVVCQGFYEWLKTGPTGKDRIPHYVKRKDGRLMCLAGLWDRVRYKDADSDLYTYTIITTASNDALRFLHDRMPVVLEPGTETMEIWLDRRRNEWSRELQSVLKPYQGELECYEVPKEVGKVGNDSPSFILPVNRDREKDKEKQNIARFFGNATSKESKPNLKVNREEEKQQVEPAMDRKDASHASHSEVEEPKQKRAATSRTDQDESLSPPSQKKRRRSVNSSPQGGKDITSFFQKKG